MFRRALALFAFLMLVSAIGTYRAAAAEPGTAHLYDSAIEASRAVMREMVERRGAPGASIAVAVRGEIVWSEGFGLADLEQGVPVTPETKFGIGSITKSLTTTLFAQMAARGLVDWDAPVERYLPDFPYANHGITPRLIAAHLSGLGDDFDTNHRYTAQHFGTQKALPLILQEPPQHPASERFSYATGPYTVIAAVLEKVSGLEFRELMRQEITEPLALKATVPNERLRVVPHRTAFYEQDEGEPLRNAHYFDPSYKWAGAGYLSTAEDMARFGAALLARRRAGDAPTEQLFRPVPDRSGKTPTSGFGEYIGVKDLGTGLGWNVAEDARGRVVFHQPGGGPGISCWLVLYPEEGLVVAILSNLTGAPVGGRVMRTTLDSFLAAQAPR